MKFSSSVLLALSALTGTQNALAFAPTTSFVARGTGTALGAIGLGPSEAEETQTVKAEKVEIVEPDHELFRDSRLTDFDRQCDDWYGKILKQGQPSCLGKVSEEALLRINTLPKLEDDVSDVMVESM